MWTGDDLILGIILEVLVIQMALGSVRTCEGSSTIEKVKVLVTHTE